MTKEAAMRLDNRPTDPRLLREFANSEGPQGDARKVAKAVQRDARRGAPKRSGNLARHIEVEEITDLDTGIEGFAIGWGDKGWYGWIVENGREGVAPQPHLVPAAIRNGVVAPGGDR